MTIEDDTAVLDGFRHAIKYRGANLYATLTFDHDGLPYSILFSISDAAINRDVHIKSDLDSLARMTSLAMREYGVDYVTMELARASAGRQTIAGILFDLLLPYCKEIEVDK